LLRVASSMKVDLRFKLLLLKIVIYFSCLS
jgi:hypothetical protein